MDKVLLASVGGVLALVGVVYGVVRADISRLNQEVTSFQTLRLEGFQRLARVEAEVQALREMLVEMRTDLKAIRERVSK